jgi:uncharacterized protein
VTGVLLDTSCIVALLDRSERHHRHCVEVVAGLDEVVAGLDAPLITCEAVIAESCYLLRDISLASEAILENIDRGVFVVPYRLTGSAANVKRLMRKYASLPMDFADACLVDMANDFQTARILTLDQDFTVYRWGKNRPFELLLDRFE